jgi:hypothetical protein
MGKTLHLKRYPGCSLSYIKIRLLEEQTIAYIGLSRLPDSLRFGSCYSKDEKAVGFFLLVIRLYKGSVQFTINRDYVIYI